LNIAIQVLPANYNFEIHKSIWRINERKIELNKDRLKIGLQFPEGLLLYSLLISDILENFTCCEVFVMGDISYGACCIDDLLGQQLEMDLLIHYGHSCLVPITETVIKILYVFVEIEMDI